MAQSPPDEGFKVSSRPSRPTDQPVAGGGGLFPVYGTPRVQAMRKRSLEAMAATKATRETATPPTRKPTTRSTSGGR